MGLSSKKTKTTSSQTTAPSTFAQPYVTQAADTLKPGYEESLNAARQFQPGLLNAANFYGDTMGGKYLESGPAFEESPYLQGTIDSTNRDISDSINSTFMDRFGSGYHTKTLARGLAENENNLRYGDAVRRDGLRQDAYARERGYQNQAGQNIAGVATAGTVLPTIPGQTYAQNVSGLLGRYLNADGTQTTKQSGGFLGDLLLAAAAGAGSFARGGMGG
jgi:hypothetical protein